MICASKGCFVFPSAVPGMSGHHHLPPPCLWEGRGNLKFASRPFRGARHKTVPASSRRLANTEPYHRPIESELYEAGVVEPAFHKRGGFNNANPTMSLITDHPPFALGLDVGKAEVHAAVLSTTDPAFLAEKVFTNDAAGHLALLAWLAKLLLDHAAVHACMEATGSYSEPLALFLHPRLARVSVVNPQCIKAFGQIGLRRSKTDPADARLIARFCLKEQPEPWRPPTPHQHKLQALARRLKSLQVQHAAEQHRVGQCLDKDVLTDLRAHLLWLKNHQAKIEAQMHQLVAADEGLCAQARLLVSIPGIGKKSAALLLAEIPHPDAYASFAGFHQ